MRLRNCKREWSQLTTPPQINTRLTHIGEHEQVDFVKGFRVNLHIPPAVEDEHEEDLPESHWCIRPVAFVQRVIELLRLIDEALADHAPDQHDTEGKEGIEQTLDDKHESLVGQRKKDETSHGHDHKEQGEHQVHVQADESIESSGQSGEGVREGIKRISSSHPSFIYLFNC